MNELNPVSLRNLNAPYLEEYFGVWAMERDRFRGAFDRVRNMNLTQHIKIRQAKQRKAKKIDGQSSAEAAPVKAGGSPSGGSGGGGYGYQMTAGGVAIVDLVGTMMKQETSLSTSTSTVKLRRTLRAIYNDESVKAVMLCIDSPGGSASGTGVLGDEIARLATKKPVLAYVDDGLCASAAYWAASQCTEISCDARALVGSIGTYAVIEDSSRAAANEGIAVHVVRAGKFKGVGTEGTPITPEQLDRWQKLVDDTNAHFLSAVSKGRKMSAEQVAKIADGDVMMGDKAKTAGLVDRVESFDDALARLEAMSPAGPVAPPALKPKSGQRASNDESEISATADVPPTPSEAEPPVPVAKDPTMDKPQAAASGTPETTAKASSTTATPQTKAEPQPATIAELRKEFAEDSDHALECAEKALTMTEAKAAYADKLKAENQQLREKAKRPGVAPVPTGRSASRAAAAADADGPSAIATRPGGRMRGPMQQEFESAVAAKVKAGMSRRDAVSAVAHEDPELHQGFLDEANAR